MERPQPAFEERTLDELTIEDERSFRRLSVYADLKEVLRSHQYVFRVLPKASRKRWDRALLLNLTYWGGGGDVLESGRVAADVVAHAGWHYVAALALGADARASQSAQDLFLGEAVASAFDIYLVGHLLRDAPRSSFLATQVDAMGNAADAAGLSSQGFRKILEAAAKNPERSFAELRELLFDAAYALFQSRGADDAFAALSGFDSHRLAPLLHHYELSNWVLYARAYASKGAALGGRQRARAVDRLLRADPLPLAWLMSNWVAPALVTRPSRSLG